jgi:hypothetical protein
MSGRFGAKLFILGLTVLPGFLRAQINTGRISGSVADPSGAVIADVAIRATNAATGVVTNTQSQPTGDYLLNFLVPGTYVMEAEKQGFQKALEKNASVATVEELLNEVYKQKKTV